MSKEKELNPEIASYIQGLSTQLDAERNKNLQLTSQFQKYSQMSGENEPNLVKYQLELREELDDIFHLLSGHEVKIVNNREVWAEPEDDRLKTFNEYGVKTIMNLLKMYVMKNTLLGYYGDDVIKWKVLDFGIELLDLFETKYETMLYYPTPEQLYERYKPLVEKDGLDINEDELYEKCLFWSQQELKQREKNLPIIAQALINMVHSSYSRAFQGKERSSLGERGINISQNSNPNEVPLPTQRRGLFGLRK